MKKSVAKTIVDRLMMGVLLTIGFLSLLGASVGLVLVLLTFSEQYIPQPYAQVAVIVGLTSWIFFTVAALTGAFDREEVA